MSATQFEKIIFKKIIFFQKKCLTRDKKNINAVPAQGEASTPLLVVWLAPRGHLNFPLIATSGMRMRSRPGRARSERKIVCACKLFLYAILLTPLLLRHFVRRLMLFYGGLLPSKIV
jgi:hypothetical protein